MLKTEKLSDNQQSFMEAHLQGKLSQNIHRSINSIPERQQLSDYAPLSLGQQQMWLLSQFVSEMPIYNESLIVYLPGRIDTDALEQSLNAFIRRHEIWRTAFPIIDGQLVQMVHPQLQLSMSVIDLHERPHAEREVAAIDLVTEQTRAMFDLTQLPLVRAMLVHFGDDDHRLYLTLHQMLFDSTVYDVFLSELAQQYEAIMRGEPVSLPPLPIQYSDFAVWQREQLQSSLCADQFAYWKQQLANAPALELPIDKPRLPQQTYHGAHLSFSLADELVVGLKRLGHNSSTTFSMVLIATFNVLLQRFSGQDDILVGTMISDLIDRDVQQLVGPVENTLVLRTNMAGDLTFLELLGRVRDVIRDADLHRDLPFEHLVKELNVGGDNVLNSLFQVLITSTPSPTVLPSGWTMTQADIETNTTTFDLSLRLDDRADGFKARLGYNTDLWKPETMQRLIEHWQVLLQAVVTDPTQHIANLPVLTAAEREQLLVTWNDTADPDPTYFCIHQRIEMQTKQSPEAIAIVFEDNSLTYQELNQRANRLAHRLVTMSIRPDMLVGVCMERSIEMIVALLAVLKAGAGYVPLDPEYPSDRVAYMIADAQVSLVLTQSALNERISLPDIQILCVDADEAYAVTDSDGDNLAIPVQLENIAYMIYTSGSTGRPKGVMIDHQSLYLRLQWAQQICPLQESDVVLCKTTFSFDPSVNEIFWPLLVGARLLVAAPMGHKDHAYLLSLILEHQVSYFNFAPFALGLFVQEPAWKDCQSVRLVMCGGEAIPPDVVEQFYARNKWATLNNMYGPTETIIFATAWSCERDKSLQILPIGRPVTGTEIYLLDEQMQPVPIGVSGELYIGSKLHGVGMARGYYQRPDLTAERFVPNPWSTEPGARLYRTGDLARYRGDGAIEYLGRVDFQVKLRGFRIEPGEIETVLLQLPGIQQVIVLVHKDASGNEFLVAYLVSDQEPVMNETLRTALKEVLPDYMIPTAFVYVDEFPLTINSKIDRKALPAPDLSSEHDNPFVAPRDPMEEMLALIWINLLNIEQISVFDNFFEIGGNSLLAMQVVSHIRQTLQIDVTILNLFGTPTVAGLSRYLNDQIQAKEVTTVPALVTVEHSAELPASFAQRSQWFLHELDPLSTAYNEPLIIRLDGPLAFDMLQRSLNLLVQRHETLRTTFNSRDGQAVQIIASQLVVPVLISDLSHLTDVVREEQILSLTQQELHTRFNLVTGPLLRVRLLRLSELSHVLLITCHHIISDGWSVDILLRDLTTLYQSQVHDTLVSLPVLPVQYADYTLWQLQWLQDEFLNNHLKYWRQQLIGAPNLVTLPPDRPRPVVQSTNGAQQKVLLPAELLQDLKSLSKYEGVTLYMTLLAAFQVILMRSSNQHDIVVGTPVANRSHREIEDLIGFFVNTLALRVDLSDNPGFRALLARVRQITLEAYAHQALPFEKVVESLQIERSLSYPPIFQVMFVMQNMSLSKRQIDELSWSPSHVESTSAKLDLTFTVQEEEQGLLTSVEYNTDLYDQSTIERLLMHWQGLLSSIVQDADQAINLLPMLSATEREQILITWNETAVAYPEYKGVYQLFEEQVTRRPDASAVSSVDGTLSYLELDCKANQLARLLRKQGVGPDTLVGICLERSTAMLVALLGVFKAGGAYVPIDPAYPADRISYMLEDSQVPCLLTQQSLLVGLPTTAATIVCLDRDSDQIAQEATERIEYPGTADNLAYVIYTSGSSGRPKGVQITQGALINLELALRDLFGVTEADLLLAVTTLSFDIAGLELYLPLICGAQVSIETRETATDGVQLLQRIQALRPTIMQATPVTWRLLLAASCSDLSSLTILCGGEALPGELRDQLLACHPAAFWNLYGPTETTIWSQASKITSSQVPVTIGRPIANTQIYILDAGLQPTPVGVAGDLYIGGVGLSRGYYHRPELTAERFIPNPFSIEAGTQLYKTGDLAFYRPDGEIEYLGRSDNQVKLRGFRIELGEIEVALQQQPNIAQAITVIHEDISGNTLLVAYLIVDGVPPKIEALRTGLKQKLPDYMLPSTFVFMETFPLTPNGKIDRRSLPTPDANTMTVNAGDYVEPFEITHYQLLNIWEELLLARPIGINDNFFHLGGHSLLASRMLARIEHVFGQKISLSTLFAGPTIGDLAHVLAEPTQQNPQSPLIPVQITGSQKPFFFLHGDWAGGAYYCFTLARYAGSDQPFYVLEPFVFDDGQEIPTIESLATSYLKLIRSVQPEGPYNLGGYCNGGVVAYEIAQQLKNQGEQVDFLALVDPSGELLPKGFAALFAHVPRLVEKFQWSIYLRLRHIYIRKVRPLLLHFSHTVDDQLLKGIRMLIDRDQKFRQLFPPIQTLMKDYDTVFSWALRHYNVRPYQGKLTCIWSREALTTRDMDFWTNKVEIKETESHIIPGTHYGILVDELQTFAESLGSSLYQVQEQKLLH